MTRLTTTPAILGILAGALADALAGCGSNTVAIGLQNVDAAASGGSSGGRNSGGVTSAGGLAGAGTTASGGVIASGGTPATGGSGTGCAPDWTLCCGQCLSPLAGVCQTPCQPAGGTLSNGGVLGTGGIPGSGTGGVSGTGGSNDVCSGRPSTCVPLCQGGVACVCSCPGSGGAGGSGGSLATGGTTGSGGATRTGGSVTSGGATGTGGTGGSTGKKCGGIAGLLCATGEICDMDPGTCNFGDPGGTCAVRPQGCTTDWNPVCGCDGKTYSNDCTRLATSYTGKSFDGACPALDAGTGDAASVSCSQVTTQTECDVRSDCHSVFLPGTTCGCSAVGCCMLFSRCADGGRANCTGPVACMAPPNCGPLYNLSYTNVCFEGCVRPSECAGVDGGQDAAPSGDASSPAALCTATGGQVSSALCCNSATDFPSSCATGACGCATSNSHTVSTCTCAAGCFMPGVGCVVK